MENGPIRAFTIVHDWTRMPRQPLLHSQAMKSEVRLERIVDGRRHRPQKSKNGTDPPMSQLFAVSWGEPPGGRGPNNEASRGRRYTGSGSRFNRVRSCGDLEIVPAGSIAAIHHRLLTMRLPRGLRLASAYFRTPVNSGGQGRN